MNRQERRRAERERTKERLFEMRYKKQIEERQERIDDQLVLAYTTCIGLALNNLYGWKGKGVMRVISEFNRLLCTIDGKNVTLTSLQEDLKRQTETDKEEGITFAFADDTCIHIGNGH